MSLSNSTVRALMVTTLAAALLATSACGMFHRKDGSLRFLPHRHNSDYANSKGNRPLEVPPDLDTPATDPAMQIPSGGGSSAGIPQAADSIAPAGAFTVADTPSGTWERVGRALERVDGVTITQRAQLLNGYDVQYKGTSMLIRATANGQATQVDVDSADGKPLRTPEALELLNILRNRIG